MSSLLEQVQVFYEIAMDIGVSLDLNEMLRKAVHTILRKLNCAAAGVLHVEMQGDAIVVTESYSTPRGIRRNAAFGAGLDRVSRSARLADLDGLWRGLPLRGEAGDGHYHVMALPDFGVLILVKGGEDLAPDVVRSMRPLNQKLARACNVCLMERRLRESEQRHRAFLENFQGIAYQTGIGDFAPLLFYGTVEQITGYTAEDFTRGGMSWDRLMHPDDLPRMREEIERLRSTAGYVADTEYRIRGRDGSLRWVRDIGRALTEAGEPTAVIQGTIYDITERKQAAEALRKAHEELERRVEERTAQLAAANRQLQQEIEERRQAQEQLKLFQQFVEVSGEGMGWADLDGCIRYANATLCRMLEEPTPNDACGKSVLTYYAPKDRERLQQRILPAVLETGSWTGEMALRSVKGCSTPTSHGLFLLRDASGAPLCFANVLTDLTARKQVEAELERHREHLEELVEQRTADLHAATEELRRSEERFKTIFERASDGILVADPETKKFVLGNSRICEMLGCRADEITSYGVQQIHPAEALPGVLEQFERQRRGELKMVADLPVRRLDGGLFYADVSATSITLAGKTWMMGFFRDVSERKRAEEERARLEAQLRQAQKMEAVGQLAGGVAHDFNNILTAILGNVELALGKLERELPPGAAVLEGLHQIERSAQRAAGLTRQLLAFSRRQIAQPQVLDLNRILSEMESMLRRLLTENIVLEFVRDPTLQRVRADPGQIEQVVMNLAVNARDAMPQGGRLTLETQNVLLDEAYVGTHPEARPGPHVLLAVSDTGIGMDAAIIERIFEPFFTTKGVGEGTGLGLATVYGIVRQSGGHVGVYSEPARGSTFKIYLPVVVAGAERTHAAALCDTMPAGTETILVCEDDIAVRDLAGQILRSAGYRVLTAANGIDAQELAAAHSGPIQLLVTDVIMPDMDGKRLADALTAVRPELQVLFVSGYTSNVIAHHGVLDEGVEFLQKPFTRGELLMRVRGVLETAKRVRESVERE